MSAAFWSLDYWNRLRGKANGIATLDSGGQLLETVDGAKITTGAVNDDRINATIAREIRKTVVDYADTANTLTIADVGKKLIFAPTVTRIQTLPTTSVQKGDECHFRNTEAFKIIINASAGGHVMSFQNGFVTLEALQDTPTLPTHWAMKGNTGGAAPKVGAYQTTVQNITSAAGTKVTFDTTDLDDNGNFDTTTNHRYQPTTPGIYGFSIYIEARFYTADEQLRARLYKNGASHRIASGFSPSDPASVGVSGVVTANGTADYFEVFSDSLADVAYTIQEGVSATRFDMWWIGP